MTATQHFPDAIELGRRSERSSGTSGATSS